MCTFKLFDSPFASNIPYSDMCVEETYIWIGLNVLYLRPKLRQEYTGFMSRYTNYLPNSYKVSVRFEMMRSMFKSLGEVLVLSLMAKPIRAYDPSPAYTVQQRGSPTTDCLYPISLVGLESI